MARSWGGFAYPQRDPRGVASACIVPDIDIWAPWSWRESLLLAVKGMWTCEVTNLGDAPGRRHWRCALAMARV